jgi:hypothetical protein
MIGAAFLAFKTRNVPSAFDESQHIANAIFLLIFFAVIIVPLDILVQDNPNASIIIQGIGQCFLGIMLLVVLFGPKLYYIASGKANDKKMLEVATSTGNKGSSGATGRKGGAGTTPVTKPSSGSKTSAGSTTPSAPTSSVAATKPKSIVNSSGTATATATATVSDGIELKNVSKLNLSVHVNNFLASLNGDVNFDHNFNNDFKTHLFSQFNLAIEQLEQMNKITN